MALVTLTLRANDMASAAVERLKRSIGGLGSQIPSATVGTRGLVGQITQGVLQANLLTSAFGAVTGAIQQGAGALQGMLGENMQLQLSNMTTASSLAAMTKQSFDDASGMVDRLNSRLAESAANLPGITSDYQLIARGITDNLIPAVKDAAGVVDTKKLEEELVSISEAYGVLGAGAGLAGQQVVFGLSRALGGSSLAELQQFEFFQEMPQIMNYLEEELKKQGKDLKDLDPAARLKLLQDAARVFVTDEFKARAGESVDGLMQGFKSAFTDPVSGIFGASRDLNLDEAGVQSVFSRFNETLKILIGSDGIFSIASSILSDLGLTIDPMKVLDSGLARVNSALTWVKGFLGNLQDVAEAGGSANDLLRLIPIYLGGFKKRITQGLDRLAAIPIGEVVADLFNGLTAKVSALLSNVDATLIGGAIGRFVGIAFNQLVSLAGAIDYGSVLAILPSVIGKVISGVGAGIVEAVLALDTRSLITLALGGLTVAIVPALVSAGLGLIGAVGSFFLSSAGAAVLAAIAPPLVGAFISLAGAIATGLLGLPLLAIAPLAIAVVATFGLLAKTVYEHREQLMANVQQFFAPIGAYISGFANLFMGLMTGNMNQAVAAAKQILTSMVQMIQRIYDTVAAAIPGMPTSGEISANQAMARANQQLAAAGGANQVVFGGAPPAPALVQNRATGQIPAGASGLMAAATREARAMPRGAEVTVSNSSELIVPARNIRSTSASSAGGVTVNLGGISINGISDPAAIADRVIVEIQARVDRAMQEVL